MKVAQFTPNTTPQNSTNYSQANVLLQPVEIDNIIKNEISRLTAEDNAVWTSTDYNRREYVHSFFQYPAMMVPVVQRKVVEILKSAKPDIVNVIDPFMGSATALVACMQSGLNIYGQDVNPLAVLIGKVRTGPYYPNAISKRYDSLVNTISGDNDIDLEVEFKGLSKWFRTDVAVELSKIVRAIRVEKNLFVRRLYWVVLAETIRLTSNDRTSTFKLHALPVETSNLRYVSPIETFKKELKSSIEDLFLYQKLLVKDKLLSKGAYTSNRAIRLQDSSINIYAPDNSLPYYDLLVTSPPYGDNKTTVTYGQHSYLPLQWIDFSDIDRNASKDILSTTLAIDNQALGGKNKELSEQKINDLSKRSTSFEEIYLKLSANASNKAKKVLLFIADLDKVIDNVFKVMKANSYQVWTIGNRTVGGFEIPNNRILIELIESKGGHLVTKIEREIINKRMAKRNNSSTLMNTEDILIFRKIG